MWRQFKNNTVKSKVENNKKVINENGRMINYESTSTCRFGNLNEDGIKSIGNNSFSKRASLKRINIPNSITYIGNNAFYPCTSLTIINIPNSVQSIGSSAFELCNINIPGSVNFIVDSLFSSIESLQYHTKEMFNQILEIMSFQICQQIPQQKYIKYMFQIIIEIHLEVIQLQKIVKYVQWMKIIMKFNVNGHST